MKNKKIVSICAVLALATTAVVGGTLAYFTDTDTQENVFTVGNISVDLYEDFNTEELKLIPAVFVPDGSGVAGAGEYRNRLEKEVYIENEGDQEAFVRIQLAIPAVHDNTEFQTKFADELTAIGGAKQLINWTNTPDTVVDGAWNWSKTADDALNTNLNIYKEVDGNTVEINGVPYTVYVATFESPLAVALAGGTLASTCDAIDSIYMDSWVTQDMIKFMDDTYGDDWKKVYVVAEAAQARGFISDPADDADAFTALNTSFGEAGTYVVDFLATAENDTFREVLTAGGK